MLLFLSSVKKYFPAHNADIRLLYMFICLEDSFFFLLLSYYASTCAKYCSLCWGVFPFLFGGFLILCWSGTKEVLHLMNMGQKSYFDMPQIKETFYQCKNLHFTFSTLILSSYHHIVPCAISRTPNTNGRHGPRGKTKTSMTFH